MQSLRNERRRRRRYVRYRRSKATHMSQISAGNLPLRAELSAWGWYEGRRVPIEEWVASLSNEGLVLFDAARMFLEEFGGLILWPRTHPDQKFSIKDINLDPAGAGVGEADRVFNWQEFLNEPMYPVGDVEGLMILVSHSGSFYCNSIDYKKKLGRNAEEAFEAMMFRRERWEIIQIYPPRD